MWRPEILCKWESLVLALNSAAASGATVLYLRRGRLPTPWEFDLTSRAPGQPDQAILAPLSRICSAPPASAVSSRSLFHQQRVKLHGVG